MKKLSSLVILLIIFSPFIVKANHIGDFYQDINVQLNCSKCGSDYSNDIHFKLFADNKEVIGKDIILNKTNNYKAIIKDLPIFREDGITEIKYDIKVLEGNVYNTISKNEIKYKKNTITSWVSVLPENLKEGKQYVLLTDNWNYESNGFEKYLLLDKNLFPQFVSVKSEYNIIDGNKSYYVLETEPNNNSIWTFNKISKNDELYNNYKNAWILTNNENKKLLLAGYDHTDYHDYIYKASSRNGWQEAEKAYNNNRLILDKINDELSRFTIKSDVIWDKDYVRTRYLGIGHMSEVKAQSEQEYAAHLIAFEKVQNKEVETAYNIELNRNICDNLKTAETIKLSNNKSINEIFPDVTDFNNINFRIANPSILKINNGKIIPLKIGETDISFDYAYNQYRIHVKVYDLNNPKTVNIYYVVLTLLLIIITLPLVKKYTKKTN